MNDERLDSLLRHAAESEASPIQPSPRLAVNVLEEVAQRQRHRRRLPTTLTVVGAYVAGMLTMWVGVPTDGPVESGARLGQLVSHEERPQSSVGSNTVHNDTASVENEEQKPASSLVAETPRPEKSVYQLFRELGDASHARGDVTSSVRYYRLALDAATEQELRSAEASDNLLLLSLKQDRMAAIELTKLEESL